MWRHISSFLLCAVFRGFIAGTLCGASDPVWIRHTIDDSSRGADGVRPADVDGDGRLDVVTGWEEGGVIRVYRNPGVDSVTMPWPCVTVGEVRSPEDAVPVDVDQDGAVDVVSCCEGKTKTVFIHWAPTDPARYWNSGAWSTQAVAATEKLQAWMFCLPEAGPRPALIAGSKGSGATISRLTVTGDSRQIDSWTSQRLCDAGWIMSLRSVDMDTDGDRDVLFSDRKGPTRSIAWLERPEDPDTGRWLKRVLGGTNDEVMFLDVGDLSGDGRQEVVAATRSAGILVFRSGVDTTMWTESMIPMPARCGTGKAVRIADLNADGRADLVVSCENSNGKHGVFWLSRRRDNEETTWEFHPISGEEEGTKFDRLELIDLDGDGDLDVMTCEERDNLGVIWYANPLR